VQEVLVGVALEAIVLAERLELQTQAAAVVRVEQVHMVVTAVAVS
jgi:hypothetical protein